MTRALFSLLILLAVSAAPRDVQAQALVADLSRHLIAITTGFTGTEVVLFGTTGDAPGSGFSPQSVTAENGDIIVVVRGPSGVVAVRRKEPTAGLWLNRSRVTYQNVPSFYWLGGTRPINEIAGPPELQRLEIGLDNLGLPTRDQSRFIDESDFRQALIKAQQSSGLYPVGLGSVTFVGQRLFRTTVSFPSNVPVGQYQVTVHLFRQGQLIASQSTPLVVRQQGLSASIVGFAREHALLYGIAAILAALAVGWAGSFAFRRA